jgi:hypothetical protein
MQYAIVFAVHSSPRDLHPVSKPFWQIELQKRMFSLLQVCFQGAASHNRCGDFDFASPPLDLIDCE